MTYKDLVREVASRQRSVALYKDQEKFVSAILEKNPRCFPQLVRKAFDLLIEDMMKKDEE